MIVFGSFPLVAVDLDLDDATVVSGVGTGSLANEVDAVLQRLPRAEVAPEAMSEGGSGHEQVEVGDCAILIQAGRGEKTETQMVLFSGLPRPSLSR